MILTAGDEQSKSFKAKEKADELQNRGGKAYYKRLFYKNKKEEDEDNT